MWVVGAPQLCVGERLQQPHLFVPASPGLLSPAAGWVMVPGARVSEEPWPELLDSASPTDTGTLLVFPLDFQPGWEQGLSLLQPWAHSVGLGVSPHAGAARDSFREVWG